jgi:thiamine-monophosphate kinase
VEPGSEEELVARQLRPRARLEAGVAARRARATAAIDLSDGLSVDAGRLALASGVGVALTGVPVAPGCTEDDALHGGEDYELLLATPDPDGLASAFRAVGLAAPVAIGACDDRVGEVRLDGRPVAAGGWRHRL